LGNIKRNVIIGYSLISAGLVLIGLSVFFMYSVFTDSAEPPSLFSIDDVKIRVPSSESGGETAEIVLISGNQASKMANMMFWSILMFFVASAGTRISGVGTKLVREIKVEVKRED